MSQKRYDIYNSQHCKYILFIMSSFFYSKKNLLHFLTVNSTVWLFTVYWSWQGNVLAGVHWERQGVPVRFRVRTELCNQRSDSCVPCGRLKEVETEGGLKHVYRHLTEQVTVQQVQRANALVHTDTILALICQGPHRFQP